MVVLIVKKYDEIQEVIGPFKDNDDADEYFGARVICEPQFRAEYFDVNEPMVLRRWRA